MLYTEKELSKNWKWILIAAAVVLIFPQVTFEELSREEATFGSIAQHFSMSGDYFSAMIQGAKTDAPVSESAG